MADKRKVRGATTREAILCAAVDIASVEGLEGLTIGRLSKEVGMSKSGLFAHFGSKQELQLAAIDRARATFIEKVLAPSEAQPEGLPRLYAMAGQGPLLRASHAQVDVPVKVMIQGVGPTRSQASTQEDQGYEGKGRRAAGREKHPTQRRHKEQGDDARLGQRQVV